MVISVAKPTPIVTIAFIVFIIFISILVLLKVSKVSPVISISFGFDFFSGRLLVFRCLILIKVTKITEIVIFFYIFIIICFYFFLVWLLGWRLSSIIVFKTCPAILSFLWLVNIRRTKCIAKVIKAVVISIITLFYILFSL